MHRRALLEISKKTGFSHQSIENSAKHIWSSLSDIMKDENRFKN